MAFAVSTPIRRERTRVRRVRTFPLNLERILALALNIGAWAVIWTVGSRLFGR